mmetsp:Transcript_42/g.101  ORF Transcript_42/g.101 Transcript_42/m.101 type:complete len:285 (-) Transcript_42:1003-1857(-)
MAMSNSFSTYCCRTVAFSPLVVAFTGTSVRIFFFSTLGSSLGASSFLSVSIASAPSAASSSLAGAGGFSTICSSMAWTLSTAATPCRFSFSVTLSLGTEPSLVLGTGPIWKVEMVGGMPGGSSSGSAHAHSIPKPSERISVSTLVEGTEVVFLGKMTSVTSSSVGLPASSAFFQVKERGKGYASCTSNSRTLNAGDSMAPWRAQPRATDSEALRVRRISWPNTLSMVLITAGMRDALPTTSTALRSDCARPDSFRQSSRGVLTRPRASAAISSSFSRVILLEKS